MFGFKSMFFFNDALFLPPQGSSTVCQDIQNHKAFRINNQHLHKKKIFIIFEGWGIEFLETTITFQIACQTLDFLNENVDSECLMIRNTLTN